MNHPFIIAVGWVTTGLIAYLVLMLIGAAWSHAIREADEAALIPLIIIHAIAIIAALLLVGKFATR